MAFSTLDEVPSGVRILLDAPIFIYHFTGTSTQCRDLLSRCEDGDVQGVTSVLTLAEVAHRLMTIEAVVKGLVTPGNVVKKLRKKPDLIRELSEYDAQVESISLMGIEVVELDLAVFVGSRPLRKKCGLLTNDSLLGATALALEIRAVASADQDFARLEGVTIFHPDDIS